LDPKDWAKSVVEVIGGGMGGKGSQCTGTSTDIKDVKLAVDAAMMQLEKSLGRMAV
jgi:hypothetical protein